MLVHTVVRASASKRLRECRNCGHVIQRGETYHYLDHWRAERSFWCRDHKPRPSDMVVSPNKRRLYLAQEALLDTAGAWQPSAGMTPLLEALDASISEARAVAETNRLPDRAPEKAEHVDLWADELSALRRRIQSGDADRPRAEVMEAAARATIFDNWHFPQ